jgi:pSer/pThr/pTyr-binding forkhead associated (FHA) protein
MQVVLVMFRADGERRSFSIVRDMTVIGRKEDCDLRIPLGEVSRKHCRLIKDGETIRLEDLGSSNGTFHNSQKVQEASLSPGDTVQIGPVTFMVQIDGVPADEDMQPSTAPASQESSDEFFPVEEAEGKAAESHDEHPKTEQIPMSDANEAHPADAESGDDLGEFDFDEEPTSNDKPA